MKKIILISALIFSAESSSMNNSDHLSNERYEIDLSVIEKLHIELKQGEHGYIDAFLVIRNNKIVIEEYYEVDYKELTKNKKTEQAQIMNKNYGSLATPQYNYYNPQWHPFYQDTNLHTIQSVSKSVTSALIGIAIEQGHIESIDNLIIDYFQEYNSLFDSDLKRSIKIKDLLNMAAGIKWDEFTHAYTDPLNNAATMENSHDWINYILSLPMEDKPGSRFVYNSGITVLLSHILHKATGMHTEEFASKFFFGPLEIEDFYWKKTPTGLTDAEGGLYLSTKDFSKVGLLYLNGGIWNEKRILTQEWVDLTMTPKIEIEDSERMYGFQWWFVPYDKKEGWIFSGSGYGGQYLMVMPEYDIVVVFNGWNIFDFERPSIEYLSSRIIEAIDLNIKEVNGAN